MSRGSAGSAPRLRLGRLDSATDAARGGQMGERRPVVHDAPRQAFAAIFGLVRCDLGRRRERAGGAGAGALTLGRVPRPNWFFAFPLDGAFVLTLPEPPLAFRRY